MSISFQQLDLPGVPSIDYKEVFKQLELQDPKDVSISEYFNAETYAKMSNLEKTRYRNMKLNYQMMIQFGIPIKKPDFMDRRKKPPPPPESSDSDQEWNPSLERQKPSVYRPRAKKSGSRWAPPLKTQTVVLSEAKMEAKREKARRKREARKLKKQQKNKEAASTPVKAKEEPAAVVVASDSDGEFLGFTQDEVDKSARVAEKVKTRNEKWIALLEANQITVEEIEKQEGFRKRGRKIKDRDKKEENSRPRYPRRSVQRLDYSELEVPDDDEFLFCDECQLEHRGDCPEHGPLNKIPDTKTAPDDKFRSDHSLPAGLVLQESSIVHAGKGVFTEMQIPKGSVFGPYEGVRLPEHEQMKAHASGYCWLLYQDNKPSHYVDAASKSTSNWMRYVNCARWESEQNLMAYQYCGQIFYRTICDIEPNKELLVWYGEDYAEELGIMVQLPASPADKKHGKGASPSGTGHVTKPKKKKARQDVNARQDHQGPDGSVRAAAGDVNASAEPSTSKHATTVTCEDDTQTNKVTALSTVTSQRKTSSGRKKHVCETCSLMFGCVEDLGWHMEHSDCPGGQAARLHPLVCVLCRTRLVSEVDMDAHKLQCGNKRRHQCNMCGRGFPRPDALVRHGQTHTGEKPYTCNICGKGLTTEQNLATHERTHTGEKPFTCDVCDYSCAASSALTTHMRTHTGHKPYTCSVCSYSCTRSDVLTSHMRTHTGEKPYTCDMCEYSCADSSALTKHKKRHHNT